MSERFVSQKNKNKTIYLLPGRGRALHEGLGEELLQRGYDVQGRALVGEFAKLFYLEQLTLIKEDLKHLNHPDVRLIAISYGAYLYLQSQIELPAFLGKVLLLSPVVGKASHSEAGRIFIPPQSDRIKKVVQEGRFPLPTNFEIHVGDIDWQCPINDIKEMATQMPFSLNIVEGEGHRLKTEYVKKILDRWL